MWVATAARFMQGRRALTEEEATALKVPKGYSQDVSDSVLLTSRDGRTYQQTFREALIRPSLRLERMGFRVPLSAFERGATGPAEIRCTSIRITRTHCTPAALLQCG